MVEYETLFTLFYYPDDHKQFELVSQDPEKHLHGALSS